VDLDFFGIISFIADLFPLVLLLVYRQLLKKKVYYFLFIWSVLSVGADMLVAITNNNQQQLIAFYSILVEVLFVGFMYARIVRNKKFKWIIYVIIILFSLVTLVEGFRTYIDGFPIYLASSAALLTLLLSILVFYDINIQNQNNFLLNNPEIFIVFAYIIYAAGNLFLFATTEKFPNIFTTPGLWSIFIIANIIKNAFLCKSILDAKNANSPAGKKLQ
jgi:hypothetical protein